MLLELIVNVVPHAQLASDTVPSSSEGISSSVASYEIGLPTCLVNCRYSRSEPKRRPHWGQSLGKSPSIYVRTISTTSSSFTRLSHFLNLTEFEARSASGLHRKGRSFFSERRRKITGLSKVQGSGRFVCSSRVVNK